MVAGLGELRVERRGVTEQVSGVLGWTHALGKRAHCLARLVLGAPSAPVVAVLSKIASNPDELVGDRLLTEVEVTQRVTPLSLRPVEQVLTDLGQLG